MTSPTLDSARRTSILKAPFMQEQSRRKNYRCQVKSAKFHTKMTDYKITSIYYYRHVAKFLEEDFVWAVWYDVTV